MFKEVLARYDIDRKKEEIGELIGAISNNWILKSFDHQNHWSIN